MEQSTNPKLTQEELEKLIEAGQIHLSDAFDPNLTDEEKLAIANGTIQSPEQD